MLKKIKLLTNAALFGLVFTYSLNAIDNSNGDAKELFKKETLSLGQGACFFDTHGKDPYFKVLKPSIDECTIIKCGCQNPETGELKGIKTASDLENMIALRLTVLNYGANTKLDKKFPGERETIVGKLLETIFLSNKPYEGCPIVDEYVKLIPMFWILKNVEEFRSLSTYMLKKFAEKGLDIPTQKTLLVIRIDNDLNLETLDKTDKDFLDTYFEVFPLTDECVKDFFKTSKDDFNDRVGDMADPKYICETIIEAILRKTEKKWDDFEGKKIAITLGSMLTGAFIAKEISDGWSTIISKTTGIENRSFTGYLINKAFPKKEKPDATKALAEPKAA